MTARLSYFQRVNDGKDESANFILYDPTYDATSEPVSQVSVPEIAHLESSRRSEPMDDHPHVSSSPTEHR